MLNCFSRHSSTIDLKNISKFSYPKTLAFVYHRSRDLIYLLEFCFLVWITANYIFIALNYRLYWWVPISLGCTVGFVSCLIFCFADLNLIFDGACLDRLVCIDWFDRTSQARFLATFRYRSHMHGVVVGTSHYCFTGSPHWPVLL